MPRSLATAHKKIAILIEEPTNPASPTVAELNAGIGGAAGAGCRILHSDWTFGPTDSESFNDRAVCEEGNVEGYDASNWQFGMTIFRYYDVDGIPDPTEDALFAAVKAKGSRIWVYERETGQPESDAWTADDELWFGGEILTDNPQRASDTGGYIKRRVPGKVQKGYSNAVVAA